MGIGKGRPQDDYITIPGYEEEEQIDFTQYNFRKFAQTYFQGNVTHQYYRRPIKQSLLQLQDNDEIAAKALWITILRFTGDMPEPRYASDIKSHSTVMSQITQTLSRSFVNSPQFKKALEMETNKDKRRKLINMTLKNTDKISRELKEALLNEDNTESYEKWLKNRRSTLEKLHFIIGHGILRTELRDEILCQICKILTNNPSQASFARGWILLSLCIGCFPPSELFLNYLRAFIHSGPKGFAPYCLSRLVRTFKNGPRTQPPCWIEFQAIKTKRPIDLTITLMDGTSKIIQADSATTAQELCESLANNLGMKDKFGFSIFVQLFDKTTSLGEGNEHVMDAISQCEQYAREQGQDEKRAPWRIFFRKEIFAPWYEPSYDKVATNLIYAQVVRGLKYGEYRCDKEGDLAMLAAQQYYIDHGLMEPRLLRNVISNYIPDYIFKVLGDDRLVKWEKLIQDVYQKVRKFWEFLKFF